MYRRISYCALLGMEGREERKEQAGKTWRDGKVEREREEGECDCWHCSPFQGSLRSPAVLLTCLDCKAWLQLQTMAAAKGNVRKTVQFPDAKEKNMVAATDYGNS